MTKLDKLNKLATEQSDWQQRAEYRQQNRHWLKYSQQIALIVLRTLREKRITQKELASRLGVSPQYINKMLKGKENLTLETIARLEQALGIKFISIAASEPKTRVVVHTVRVEEYVTINLNKSINFRISEIYTTSPVKEKFFSYGQA